MPTVHEKNVEGHAQVAAAQIALHQKRVRAQLSCTSCRQSKLKCDRGQPCSQCVKKDRGSACVYAAMPTRKKPSRNMKSRLQHLESLVKDLMKEQAPADDAPPTTTGISTVDVGDTACRSQALDSEESATASKSSTSPQEGIVHHSPKDPAGQLVVGNREIIYVGATHWAAILDDIEKVKGYFNEEPEEDTDFQTYAEGSAQSMILGILPSATKSDILAVFPERSAVDRLVSRYFNSSSPGMYIIHKPTFQQEYQEFWNNPESKPIAWIGLLGVMISTATLFAFRAGEEPLESRAPPLELIKTYRNLSSQCLVMSNYTSPGPYALEAFVLYVEGEFLRARNSQSVCWLLNGMAVRLALKMGYHRDAKNHPNVSAFEGEMRRRKWGLIAQMDYLLSFHVGLPSMVSAIQSDTESPHNLYDEDFNEHSALLPPSRPHYEHTPIAYVICKSRLIYVFGKIAEMAHSLTPPTYDEVMSLDARLQQAYHAIPPFLMIRAVSQCITDSADSIIQRFNVILLFHKSRCVLHRRYLLSEDSLTTYSYSVNSCLDSAMEILHYQSEINEAIQPGGPLSRDRWYISALAMHDFLLASMIIYLRLTHDNNSYPVSDEQRDHLIGMLEKSQKMYDAWREDAYDTTKSSKVLEFILQSIKRGRHASSPNIQPEYNDKTASKLPLFGAVPSLDQPKDGFQISNDLHTSMVDVDQSMATSLAVDQFNFNYSNDSSRSLDDLAVMIDTPVNLDWGLWDNRINNDSDVTPDLFWPTNVNFDDLALIGDELNMNGEYNM